MQLSSSFPIFILFTWVSVILLCPWLIWFILIKLGPNGFCPTFHPMPLSFSELFCYRPSYTQLQRQFFIVSSTSSSKEYYWMSHYIFSCVKSSRCKCSSWLIIFLINSGKFGRKWKIPTTLFFKVVKTILKVYHVRHGKAPKPEKGRCGNKTVCNLHKHLLEGLLEC